MASPMWCDDTAYEAVFAKVAINVVRRSAEEPNQLPTILRGWFGPDAGQPGTRHEVALEPGEGGWVIRPIGRPTARTELWRAYSREQIPPLFGLEFSQAIWNKGYVFRGNQIFLLVTLDKSTKTEDFHSDSLRSQFATLKKGRGAHRKYSPIAFTEQGVAMLSSVLRSPRAVQVNVEIMRAFVRLRRMLESNAELARKLDALERKYDGQFPRRLRGHPRTDDTGPEAWEADRVSGFELEWLDRASQVIRSEVHLPEDGSPGERVLDAVEYSLLQ